MSDMNLNTNDVVGMLLAVIEGSPYATKAEIDMAKKLAEKATMEVESLPEEDKIEIYKVFENTSAGPSAQEILKDTFSKENLQAAGNKAKELGAGAISRVDEFASGISDMMGVMGNKRYPITKSEIMPNDKSMYGQNRYQQDARMSNRFKEGSGESATFGLARPESGIDRYNEEIRKKLTQNDLMDLLGRF